MKNKSLSEAMFIFAENHSPLTNIESLMKALNCNAKQAANYARENFTTDKTEYVVCFALTPNHRVALIRKNRPEWQRDRLNGIGGKIESHEGWMEAGRREFREEAGIDFTDWQLRGTMEGPDWRCFVLYAMDEKFYAVKTMTDEPVRLYPTGFIKQFGEQMLDNIPAILQLVMPPPPPATDLSPPFFTLRYA